MAKDKQNGDSDIKKNQKNEDSNNKKNQCKEIVLKVYMHCQGCASQVSHCLKDYDGVEQTKTEIEDNKVVVYGKFDDPTKILRRVQKKFSKNAELISPKVDPNQDHKKSQPKKESAPEIKTAILRMNMHCEGCVYDIKRCILKIEEGIQTVEPDRSKSTVVVRGVMDPPKLVEKITKKLRKHVELLSYTIEKNKDNTEKDDNKNKNNKKNNNKNKENDANMIYSYPPQYSVDYIYPSQIFSDENANSCLIM